MFVMTVTQIRPLPFTPFYIFSEDSIRLIEEFKTRGKLLETSSTMSEDMLTRTSVWKWDSEQSYSEFQSNDANVSGRENQVKYNEINGIIKIVSLEEQ